jgi:hypothetical protein
MLTSMPSTPHSQEDAFGIPSVTRGQRYYFDTHDGQRFIPDNEGLVLSGLDEAKEEAVKALPHMARDGLAHGDCREFVVEVRDEAGHKVWRARLSLVVEAPSDSE